MIIKIRATQIQVLAEFCKDLAKGVTLAAILGQGFQIGVEGMALSITLGWTIVAIIFLLAAIKLSSYERP